MNDDHTRIARTKEEAHAAIVQAYTVAQTLLMDGKRVRISVGEDNDPITIKQRRFFHGPVLTQISEQVRVGGVYKENLDEERLVDLSISKKETGEKRFNFSAISLEIPEILE